MVKHTKRKKNTMVIWILLVLLFLWMCLHYLPVQLEHFRPLPEATALIPLLLVPLLIIFLITLSRRAWAQSFVSLLLIAIEVLWSLGYFMPLPHALASLLAMLDQTAQTAQIAASVSPTKSAASARSATPTASATSTTPTSAAQTITVMTINARYGRADTSSILHQVKLHKVDVLCVQEVTSRFVDRLDREGISQELPFKQLGNYSSKDNGGFNAIWTRIQPIEAHPQSISISSSQIPTVTLSVNGQRVLFASTHPKSPGRGGASWSSSISSLSAFSKINNADLKNSSQVTANVVMGDLNSNLHHAVLRSVLSSGLTDSSYALHKGMNLTFPASWPFFPALIEIDHVLYTGQIQATSLTTQTIPHTDHKALIATLQVKNR